MNDDELLRAMCESYWNAAPSIANSMRSILELLHANGYRRCAEGQKVTQYCSAWEQADKACRDLTEKVIPNIRERAEKAEAEVERLRAEVERLRNCCDELRAIGNIIHDPRVHNTITIAEWCDEAQAELRRLKSGHCKDCCCARSWEALEITGYTGKSIPEEIEALKAEVERLRAVIEAAPHTNICMSRRPGQWDERAGAWRPGDCDCWKRDARDKK